MAIRGDLTKLHELGQRIGRIGGPSERRAMLQNLGEEARTQALLGFEQGRDPYGRPWKPVLRGGQPLRSSGNLQNSIHSQIVGSGFALFTTVKYAAVHQYGATIRAVRAGALRFQVGGRWASKKQVTIPQRQYIPTGTLGPIWMAAFEKVIDKVLHAQVGG